MNLQDYLIPAQELDWSSLLKEWSWLLPRKLSVWIFTRSGDLFMKFPDDSINWLEVGGGKLSRVAESRDDFCAKIDESGVAENWLLIPVVDDLVKSGLILEPGKCYGYKMLPILGGSYGIENRVAMSIREHFGFCGEIHRQIADLPDGTKVEFEWKT